MADRAVDPQARISRKIPPALDRFLWQCSLCELWESMEREHLQLLASHLPTGKARCYLPHDLQIERRARYDEHATRLHDIKRARYWRDAAFLRMAPEEREAVLLRYDGRLHPRTYADIAREHGGTAADIGKRCTSGALKLLDLAETLEEIAAEREEEEAQAAPEPPPPPARIPCLHLRREPARASYG